MILSNAVFMRINAMTLLDIHCELTVANTRPPDIKLHQVDDIAYLFMEYDMAKRGTLDEAELGLRADAKTRFSDGWFKHVEDRIRDAPQKEIMNRKIPPPGRPASMDLVMNGVRVRPPLARGHGKIIFSPPTLTVRGLAEPILAELCTSCGSQKHFMFEKSCPKVEFDLKNIFNRNVESCPSCLSNYHLFMDKSCEVRKINDKIIDCNT